MEFWVSGNSHVSLEVQLLLQKLYTGLVCFLHLTGSFVNTVSGFNVILTRNGKSIGVTGYVIMACCMEVSIVELLQRE